MRPGIDCATWGTSSDVTGADSTSSVRDAGPREILGKTLVGFGVALVLVYLLGWAVGWGAILAALDGAQYRWVWIACLSTALGLVAWGKVWQIVLGTIGVEVTFRRLVVTYYAATFANYVTPLGQAGGEPFIAYVVSVDTDASYEEGLASVVTADLLNLLPFFNFAAVGLGYLLLREGLSGTAEELALALGAMAVGVPALVYLGWHYRGRIEQGTLWIARPLAARTDRLSIEGIQDRVHRFYEALDLVANRPRRLLYALAFSYVGWVFFALPLYFAGLVLDAPIELLLVLFIVPASTLAGLVPTPGGLGAVEGALVALIVALAPVAPASAFAIAVLYRVASYWFAIVVGGIAALWVTVRA